MTHDAKIRLLDNLDATIKVHALRAIHSKVEDAVTISLQETRKAFATAWFMENYTKELNPPATDSPKPTHIKTSSLLLRAARLEGLNYALNIAQGRRVLNRPPAYLACVEEMEIFLKAAIDRVKAGEDMNSTATCQSDARSSEVQCPNCGEQFDSSCEAFKVSQ